MNTKTSTASGCPKHTWEGSCELDPYCTWIKNKCYETICSDHKFDTSCDIHPSCTWYDNKCYTIPYCEGTVMPKSLPSSKGCYGRVYPRAPPYDSMIQKPDEKCRLALESNAKDLGDGYNPDMCMKDLAKNKQLLINACNMTESDLQRAMNWRCEFISKIDAETNALRQCNQVYNTSPLIGNTTCTINKDLTNRNSNTPADITKWKTYPTLSKHDVWYAFSCKNGPTCKTK